MKSIGRVLFWRYARGSWQYDILCGLILVFIFATPKSVFDGSYFRDRVGKLQMQPASEAPETSNNPEKKTDDNRPAY